MPLCPLLLVSTSPEHSALCRGVRATSQTPYLSGRKWRFRRLRHNVASQDREYELRQVGGFLLLEIIGNHCSGPQHAVPARHSIIFSGKMTQTCSVSLDLKYDLQECNHCTRFPLLSLSCHHIPESSPVQERHLGPGETEQTVHSSVCMTGVEHPRIPRPSLLLP